MPFLSAIFNAHEENCVNAVCRLRDSLELRITTPTLVSELKEHPNYPSLLGVSEALNRWNVGNISAKIAVEKLKDLPAPFMAQVSGDNKYFVVVRKLEESPASILVLSLSSKKL